MRLIVKKMLKVGRKKKKRKENKETKRERKKVKKQTNSNAWTGFELAPLRQLLASRAWNFTTQPKKQNTRYVQSLNIMSRSRDQAHCLKKKHFSRGFKFKLKCKKSKVNRANIFCRKIVKQRERYLPNHLFSNGRFSWCSIEVLPSSPINNLKRQVEFLWLCKES